MRLRRALMITALSALVWAATASAECAWILWATTDTKSSQGGYVQSTAVYASYVTLADCVKKLDGEQASANIIAPGNANRLAPTALDVLQILGQGKSYRCLPDTVDPRGSKGSR